VAPDSVLLGDSGYGNTDYLVTPIAAPRTAQEERFNRSHRRTRRIVECAIGVLKQRFRCLLLPQHLAPDFVGEIVRCCAALHNLVLDPDEAADILSAVGDPNLEAEESDEEEGQDDGNIDMRMRLVQTF
jgi:hypothetical protein